MKNWVILLVAILAETVATSALKASEGFTRLGPSALTVVGYALAFYCLSLTLRSIPIGVAYAVWSAVGIILITLVGVVVYKQVPDAMTLLGLALIIAGVLVLNLLGKTSVH
ncbi:multidrug efflux SMR transporter [Hymenobacter aerilatus]|uniref:Multidrug efflux SMR transporter n=1 Tax=Hymenobacter aerilatus TaxID=2932251 RepID=A0A8T9SX71_9BACT|nr:multidrug efflux SMR transporter [Hymenobacter aerilatus]UOR05544.1 multidrug efflux SMR transporter [Hymenobacter aerilatus]